MTKTVISQLASSLQARNTCIEKVNTEWADKHQEIIDQLIRDFFPSGSGFDSGTKLNDKSTEDKIIFDADFHHMNDVGYYDGWTSHQVIVTPSFTGHNIRVTGQNKRDIKDYIAQTFSISIDQEIKFNGEKYV